MIDAEKYGPWAVVCGASEGIGEAFARALCSAGINVVLVSRRQALLDELAASIEADRPSSGTAYGSCRAVAVDLTAPDAAESLVAATTDLEVGLLIYNAGADTMAVKFLDRSLDQVMHLIMLNVVTLSRLVHHLAAPMRARRRGGIILLGSMAGLAGTGWVATYSATKAYDQILAEGLWRELRGDNVDVLALIAGATATPAHERMGARATPEYPPMDPAEVAREGLSALGSGPLHVAGQDNRVGFAALSPASRVDVIEQMTRGTQLLFGVRD